MKRILICVVLVGAAAIAVRGQSSAFTSKEFGFTMSRPDGWVQIGRQVLDDSIARMELTDSAREGLKKEADDSILLFLFVKHLPEARRGVNPKIEARVIFTGLQRNITFEEFEPAITASFRSFGASRKNYLHIRGPAALELAGAKGVFQISRFSIRTDGRTEYNIRSRTLAIPFKNYYFQISFVDEFGGDDCSAIFDELVKSIKIGNH